MTVTVMQPQVSGLPALKLLRTFGKDPLGTIARLQAQLGDRAHTRLPGEVLLALSRPSDVGAVLVTYADAMHKSSTGRRMKMIVGEGLLTSEGETWRTRRRLAAPSLKRSQIAAYGDAMVRHAAALADDLAQRGGEVDLQVDMMSVTLKIVLECLLGADLPEGGLHTVETAMDDVMGGYGDIVHSTLRLLPEWWPSRPRSRLLRGRAALDKILRAVIAQRRADPSGDDLLARLIRAQADAGTMLDDTALRDEVATMFLAGHETTALALTYALILLSKNPAALAQVEAEADTLEGPATMADLARLPYTAAVIDETLRLYPPAWIIGREATRDIPDFPAGPVAKGTQIMVLPWLVHRDPRWWPEPLAFKPERWIDAPRPARFTYLPFGGGPRVCIGNHFARMEAVLVLTTLARTLRIKVAPGFEIVPRPSITLRLAGPVPAQVEVR